MGRCIGLIVGLCVALGSQEVDTPVLQLPEDAEENPVVVRIDGIPITIRDLENALLRKEGTEAVFTLVEKQVQKMDWDKVDDEAAILQIGDWKLQRKALAAHLLRGHAKEGLTDLVGITLVENALRKEGIIVGDLLLDKEVDRYRLRFAEKMAGEGVTAMPFEDYLNQHENMTIAELKAQPGFRMEAGLHALVHRRVDLPDEVLRPYFDENKPLFGRPEQVRLKFISFPYEIRRGLDGKEVVVDGAQDSTMGAVAMIYRGLQRGDSSFEDVWAIWGKKSDPQAGEGGDIGWVGLDGKRSQVGAIPVAPETMLDAFNAAEEHYGKPRVRPHAKGVDLYMVLDRRPGFKPTYEQARDEVKQHVVETQLEEYSRAIMRQLKGEADIVFERVGNELAGKAMGM